MRLLLAAIVLLIVGMSLPWWPSAGRSQLPDDAPRLAIGPWVTLDPVQASGLDEFRLLGALFEPLVRLDPSTLTPRPALAERWESSDGDRVWTFHLRDARWSDDSPVTAAQMVAGIARHRQGASAALIAGLTEITALDDRTVRLTWNGPAPYALALLATPVFTPVHASGELPGAWADPTRIIGNGPLLIASHHPRHHDDLLPSPTYAGPHTAAGPLRLLVIEDPGTAVRLYLDGRIDAALRLHADTIADLLRTRHPELHTTAAWGTELYRLRCSATIETAAEIPVAIRRALTLAIDREALVRDLLGGNGVPATTLVPTSAITLGYTPPITGSHGDIAAACLALRGIAVPTGLELLVSSSSPERLRVAEWICDRWKRDLGIDVQVVPMPATEAMSRTRAGRYDISRGSLVGDYLDPGYFLTCFRSGSGMNRTGWSDKAYDHLLANADRQTTSTARMQLLQQAEMHLLDQAPIIPLYHYRCSFLVKPHLSGITANALELINFSEVKRTLLNQSDLKSH